MSRARLQIHNTKNQLKAVQKIEHDLAYMDSAKIFCLQFYWLLVYGYAAALSGLPAAVHTAATGRESRNHPAEYEGHICPRMFRYIWE